MVKTRSQDMFSEHDGEAFIRLNGSIIPVFEISKITAKLEAVVENGCFLNDLMEQATQRGLRDSGDMIYYHTTPAFIQTMRDYKNGDPALDISLQFYADSTGSQYGRIGVTLPDATLADIGLTTLDNSSGNAQTTETTFTSNDLDLAQGGGRMDRSLMWFLHPDQKPNATFKLNSLGDAEFEVHVLTTDEMAQMSAEVQTKGFKGLEAFYPTIVVGPVRPNLHSAKLLDALSEREGRKILSPMDALRPISTISEIGALLSICNEYADVTVDFGRKAEEAKN